MSEGLVRFLAEDSHSASYIVKMLAAKIFSSKEMRFPFGGENVEIVFAETNEYADEEYIVLKVDEKFFKFTYSTNSFDMDWAFVDITEVFPKRIIKYDF